MVSSIDGPGTAELMGMGGPPGSSCLDLGLISVQVVGLKFPNPMSVTPSTWLFGEDSMSWSRSLFALGFPGVMSYQHESSRLVYHVSLAQTVKLYE